MRRFEPIEKAARARLAEVHPDAYAQTRNSLDGAVTRLSPYITHGILSLRDVYAEVHARYPLDAKHKFVFELGWRVYYRHVWAHLGEDIYQSLHPGLLPDEAYLVELPADVVEARTGIAAIDLAVSELYATGYLHNHARMWLASYLVHLRKVHWRTAAQWMLGHLLDGDVASNHLSWQWVAGTGSSKPYLFNADNVAKYAPAHWHSPGTVIDTSYDALDHLARSATAVDHRIHSRLAGAGMAQPPLLVEPSDTRWSVPGPDIAVGRDVWLLHPWSLGAASKMVDTDVLLIGVGFAEIHGLTPWSARRWNFVTEGLLSRTPTLWWGSVQSIAHALRNARSVRWQSEPHADRALESLQSQLQAAQPHPVVTSLREPSLFGPVEPYCESFAKWWRLSKIAMLR
jgi:deoxyribodipyrimidine photo-lyase